MLTPLPNPHIPNASNLDMVAARLVARLQLSDFSPATDRELVGLLTAGLKFISPDHMLAYLDKVKRFNSRPVNLMESLPGERLIDWNSGRLVYWYNLRQDLQNFPQFFEAAEKVALSPDEASRLLFSLVDCERHEFVGVTDHIKTMTKLLEKCAEKGLSFKDELPQIEEFFRLLHKEGEALRALNVLRLGVAAGMSIKQAIEIVNNVYDRPGIAGYTFMALYDELDLLGANHVSGDVIFHAVKAVIACGESFKDLAQATYAAVARSQLSQTEIFGRVIEAKKQLEWQPTDSGNLVPSQPSLLDLAFKDLLPTSASNGPKSTVARKEPLDYFPDIAAKTIVHGILPYRIKRSLRDGLRDLRKLMKEELQEGAWIFDPKSETWYSLGGRTNLGRGRVGQEFISYDVSLLSQSPVYVHIHPEQGETFIRPDRDSLVYPQLQNKLTKFSASMPSAADLHVIVGLMTEASRKVPVRGLIVTPVGLTEIRMPNTSQQIEQLAARFTDLKDQVLLDFDAGSYLHSHGLAESDRLFVGRLLETLNERLPLGFQISIRDVC